MGSTSRYEAVRSSEKRLDASKAEKEPGFKAKTTLEEGLRKTME